jgi:ATP-dependent helicase HrpA
VGEQALFEFYDERIPADVVSAAHFDRWWKHERARDHRRLHFTRELLVDSDALGALDGAALPDSWRQGELTLALSYRFEPGSDGDGVTVHIPLNALARLRSEGFDWLVPGLRVELVTALIRSLPKDLRRPLVPIPELAAEVVASLNPRRGALVDAVARELERLRGVRVPANAWDLSRLPAHLRMTFRVEDGDGGLLAQGHDLDILRAAVRPRLRAELAAATGSLERHGLADWDGIGDLPQVVALPGTGDAVRGYPALVDEGERSVGVRVLETPAAQRTAMHAGTRRLLALTVPSPLRSVERGLSSAARLTLAGAPHGGAAAALDDAVTAALDALIASGGGPAWTAAGFAALREYVAGRLADSAAQVVAQLVEILDAARAVQLRLDALPAEASLRPARLDIAAQIGGLVYPGFVAAAGTGRLADIVRYLRATARRLDRLPDAPASDRDRMGVVHQLEDEYRHRRDTWPADQPLTVELLEVPWMLQELRVSHFAQGLGVRGQVSAKRIRRALAEARSAQ